MNVVEVQNLQTLCYVKPGYDETSHSLELFHIHMTFSCWEIRILPNREINASIGISNRWLSSAIKSRKNIR